MSQAAVEYRRPELSSVQLVLNFMKVNDSKRERILENYFKIVEYMDDFDFGDQHEYDLAALATLQEMCNADDVDIFTTTVLQRLGYNDDTPSDDSEDDYDEDEDWDINPFYVEPEWKKQLYELHRPSPERIQTDDISDDLSQGSMSISPVEDGPACPANSVEDDITNLDEIGTSASSVISVEGDERIAPEVNLCDRVEGSKSNLPKCKQQPKQCVSPSGIRCPPRSTVVLSTVQRPHPARRRNQDAQQLSRHKQYGIPSYIWNKWKSPQNVRFVKCNKVVKRAESWMIAIGRSRGV